jgi:hypothetical protein
MRIQVCSGNPYAIPAYVYPCEQTPSAGARIHVKCIRTGIELHVVVGIYRDTGVPPNFEDSERVFTLAINMANGQWFSET